MSFSYSKISLYNKCPYKYKKKYIDKDDVFTDSPVLEKGRYIHLLLDNYPELPEYEFVFSDVKNKRLEMIEFVSNLARNDVKLKYLLSSDVKLFSEKNFFLKDDMTETDKRQDSLFNGIIDYVGKKDDAIIIVDWKTGSTQKHASLDQLKFYSMWAFSHFSEINILKICLYFIEQNIYVMDTIDRESATIIKNNFINKTIQIVNDTTFEKKKTEECLFCKYSNECNKLEIKRSSHSVI